MPTDRRHAGWYHDDDDAREDEDDAARERWWNGTQWTTHTRLTGMSPDVAALEGESPHAWSTAGDGLVATVDEPYRPAVAPGPDPLDVPPGWYLDPQGNPALRWWNGWAWTEHTGPLPPPPVVLQPGKSVGVALVLTFFFGPFGMLYSTVTGALIMLVVLFVVGFLVFGLFWFLLWPLAWAGSMVWGALAAANSPSRPVPYWR